MSSTLPAREEFVARVDAKTMAPRLQDRAFMQTRSALAMALVLVGCSGAPSSDLFASSDQDTASPSTASTTSPAGSSTSSPSGSSSSSSGSSGSGSSTGSGGSDPGSAPDAGGTNANDAGNSGTSLPTCTSGETEVEPNDSFADANQIADSKFCGEINPATDVDFATFTLAKTAKSVSVDYNATDKISIKVTTQGTTVEITGASPPPIPTNPGDVYYIEVAGASGSMPAYVITVKQ